jgi:hypothetical protein
MALFKATTTNTEDFAPPGRCLIYVLHPDSWSSRTAEPYASYPHHGRLLVVQNPLSYGTRHFPLPGSWVIPEPALFLLVRIHWASSYLCLSQPYR